MSQGLQRWAYYAIVTRVSLTQYFRPVEGQFRYPAVQRYLHDLTSEMGEHLDSINSSLSVFIDIGPLLSIVILSTPEMLTDIVRCADHPKRSEARCEQPP